VRKKSVLILPARMLAANRMEFPIENIWGTSLKIAIRDKAKKLPLYWRPVEIDPPVAGRSDGGDVIPISNLGRWVFGTPGYMGHIVVESFCEHVAFRCPDIPEAMDLIIGAINALE